MKKLQDCYKAIVGFGVTNTYVKTLYLLDINVVDTKFGGYTLRSKDKTFTGKTKKELTNALSSLVDFYGLQYRSSGSRDVVLVYVDDLDKIRAFFNKKEIETDVNFSDYRIYYGCIEFRCWKDILTNRINDNIMDALLVWEDIFAKNRYPYISLAQYPRKQIKKMRKGMAYDLFPADRWSLYHIYQAVHGGVLYSDGVQDINTPMLGVDLTSAYIYSIVYEKHCASAPVKDNSLDWRKYINNPDYGSIGVYEIEYECWHGAISCYHIYNDKNTKLQVGRHKVMISLSSVDLHTLMIVDWFDIISINCKILYTFKLDYLPEEIREFCLAEFVKKCTLDKESMAYKVQKQLLNAGFFGNFLYEAKKVYDKIPLLAHEELKQELYHTRKDASTTPIWGIFTMAYVKQTIITVGSQVDGWHYSDTDSIYCDLTINNSNIINNYNSEVCKRNVELMKKLKYTGEKVATLGQFDVEGYIKRYRYFNPKHYAYQLMDNTIIVKAAGIKHREYDDTVFTDPNFRFLIERWETQYSHGHYYRYPITQQI